MSIIPRGKNTFMVRVYVGRDPITKKRIEINETVRGSLSYAKKREAKLKEQKYSGRLLKSPRMTVDALHELFLDSVRHTISVTTYHGYEDSYKRYARPIIGAVPIASIKASDIQKLFNFLLDEKGPVNGRIGGRLPGGLGISPGTSKVLRSTLAGAFQLAVDNEFIAENPVSKIKLPPTGQPSATSLTLEEARAFTSARDPFWFGNAFVFQIHTGLRNHELMALIWDDVDFQNGIL
jgi:integrase